MPAELVNGQDRHKLLAAGLRGEEEHAQQLKRLLIPSLVLDKVLLWQAMSRGIKTFNG